MAARKLFRGQMSFEFLLVAIAVLLVFLALFGVYADKEQSFADSRQTSTAMLLAQKISRAANAVMASQNGTSATVVFGNATAELGHYAVCANNWLVDVRWKNNSRTVAQPVLSKTALSQASSTLVSCAPANASNATITNINGELYVG